MLHTIGISTMNNALHPELGELQKLLKNYDKLLDKSAITKLDNFANEKAPKDQVTNFQTSLLGIIGIFNMHVANLCKLPPTRARDLAINSLLSASSEQPSYFDLITSHVTELNNTLISKKSSFENKSDSENPLDKAINLCTLILEKLYTLKTAIENHVDSNKEAEQKNISSATNNNSPPPKTPN